MTARAPFHLWDNSAPARAEVELLYATLVGLKLTEEAIAEGKRKGRERTHAFRDTDHPDDEASCDRGSSAGQSDETSIPPDVSST